MINIFVFAAMWPKRKRPISPQLGEGSPDLQIPPGDHDPPSDDDDDPDPDPLNAEDDMRMASALGNLDLGPSNQKRPRHCNIEQSQPQDGHQQEQPMHLEDGPDLPGQHGEAHLHHEADQAHGWGDHVWHGAERPDPQGHDAAGWIDQGWHEAERPDPQGHDAHGWRDQGLHEAAVNDNVFWEWNYTTESWDYWQFHNNWWYKATWRWYLWWEPQEN